MEYNIHRWILHVIYHRIILVNQILIGGCLQSTPTFCPFSSYDSGLHHIPIIIRATWLSIPIGVARISSKVWTCTKCSGWNMSKTLIHWVGELFSSFYGTEWFLWIHQGLSYGLWWILCEIDWYPRKDTIYTTMCAAISQFWQIKFTVRFRALNIEVLKIWATPRVAMKPECNDEGRKKA